MPRQARKKSESGIYHVMLRGINRQQIFEDPEDYGKFLEILSECKAICGYKLFAYCLMGNHIHLLIKEDAESLEQIFKRICGRFVYWYNIKYRRIGHLFQDRFKSEPVDTDAYFWAVLRYIHQNPVKAGACKQFQDYVYSSYPEYIGTNHLVDTDFALGMVSKDELIEFHQQVSDMQCMDIPEKPALRVTDEQACVIIRKISKCSSAAEFQALEAAARDKYIEKLRERGLSIRQLSRLTGISIGVIRKR